MPVTEPTTIRSAIAELCPECGLCCKGVLFADVELQQADDPEKLASLGLRLERKGRKLAFAQPCACYDGKLCRAYADRPMRCRTFECRVLKRVQSGELAPRAARGLIARAREQVQSAKELIRAMDGRETSQPLTTAYAELMVQPIDLACPGTLKRSRAKLAALMHQVMTLLQREFLT